ncbi:MAG: SpoIIE family protein phosphatase [Kiritimatiellae bacterium]|nr:SpoIIE family protein phosphatase [Kiritimatiellia bacterium]
MKPAKRANIPVVVVTAALFVAIASFVALSTSKMMEREARSTVENVVKATVGRIDGLMAAVESAVKNSTWIVEEHLDSPEYMFKITGELVQNNPFIVGSTIAFEPNFFPAKGYYYSAFSYRDGNGRVQRIQQGGEDFKYHGMDWYRVPKEAKTPSWCEPYFDKGGAEVMMSTYSLPLVGKDGKVYAVLTADVSLEELTRQVAAIKPYPDSYAVLLSQKGMPLVAAPEGASALTDTVKILGKAGNGWTMELICPLANILQGSRTLVNRIVLFSVMGLGLIFFVSWSFSTRLQRVTAANERLGNELSIARTIQSSVLNRRIPPCLGAVLRPAREVGGDFYDFIEKDGVLYFAIGDASGKGIPAALFAFLAGAGFHLSADLGLPPSEAVSRINALLCKDNDASMFVTLFVGRLELATGKLEYCNAGHPPIVVVRPDGSSEFLAAKRNLAAGALEGFRYVQETATFAPGTRLIVYTDGVTEAERNDHAQYGNGRLLAFASAHAKESPADLIGSLVEEIDGFAAGAEQSDDITALAVLVGGEAKTEEA